MIFRNVQALRAIAALSVVAVHIGNPNGFEARYISSGPILMRAFATAGWYGVDLFFVISGFIMTVTTWKLFGERKAPIQFLLRRIVRIYPPYWLLLLIVFAVYLAHPNFVDSHATVRPDIVASFLLLPQRGEPLLLVSWTLVFEMAFYLVFAFALCFRRAVLPLVLTGWVVVMVLSSVAWGASENPYLQFLATPLPIEFLFGIAAGALVKSNILKRAPLALATGFACVAVLVTFANIGGDPSYPNVWWRALLGGCGFASILYGVVVLEKAKGVLFPRWLDTLGDASYAIYLWHIPVLSVLGLLTLRLHAHGAAEHALLIFLAFALVIGVGLFVYRFVEQPMTRAFQRLLPRDASARAVGHPRVPATAAD